MVEAPCLTPGQVRHQGAGQANEVDPAVRVEARVFDGQQRVFHQCRRVRDGHKVAVLLAKFADQHVVGRVDAQRQLGPVVGHRIQRGQAGDQHQCHIGCKPGKRQDHQGGKARQAIAG